MTPEEKAHRKRAAIRAYQRVRRNIKKLAGECRDCSNTLPPGTLSQCPVCKEKAAANKRKREAKLRAPVEVPTEVR